MADDPPHRAVALDPRRHRRDPAQHRRRTRARPARRAARRPRRCRSISCCAEEIRTRRGPATRYGDRRRYRSADRSSRSRTRLPWRDRRTTMSRRRRHGRSRSGGLAAPNDAPSMKPSPKQDSTMSTSSLPHARSTAAARKVEACSVRTPSIGRGTTRTTVPDHARSRCRWTTGARPRAVDACSTCRRS